MTAERAGADLLLPEGELVASDGAGLEVAGEVAAALEFGEGAAVDGADVELAGGIFASRAAEFGVEEAAPGFAELGVDDLRERRK